MNEKIIYNNSRFYNVYKIGEATLNINGKIYLLEI
ncbi:hypothetical protein ES703_30732 [subsurface metagenome]